MYKPIINCYGEVVDNYLEISTPLNMDLQDFLKNYVETKFKKHSSIFDKRKNTVEECDYNVTLNFAKFLVTTLNDALKGNVSYKNPAMKNAYFEKKREKKEFGITHYKVSNVVFFEITEVPASKIGKILSEKRIYKNSNNHSNEKIADLSIDWMGFSLDKKDKLSIDDKEKVQEISMKVFGARNGFVPDFVDKQNALYGITDVNDFVLFSGVMNHMMYTQMLMGINERFNKSIPTLLEEEKVLKGIFVKNTMVLDAFRDLAQKGYEMHPAIWRAAFSSLVYGDVPFFQNFKLSHIRGIDKFYGQVYKNLKLMDEEFENYSDKEKENALQRWRGIFSNLTSDRVLFSDIASYGEIQDVFTILKLKAMQFYKRENKSGNELDVMYSVIKKDANDFLVTYGFNVSKINEYMPNKNASFETALNNGLIKLEQKNSVMKKTAQIDIESMFKELGFENIPLYKLFYAQAIKSAMMVFYPEIELSAKDFSLDNKVLSEIKNFTHAAVNRLENLEKLVPKSNNGLVLNFMANEDVMLDSYPTHVLSVVGTLVNASIIGYLNNNCVPEIKPFQSMDNRLSSRYNGDIFNEALFAIRKTVEFFENKDYVKNNESIEKVKSSIREHSLKYQLNESHTEKREVRMRRKV